MKQLVRLDIEGVRLLVSMVSSNVKPLYAVSCIDSDIEIIFAKSRNVSDLTFIACFYIYNKVLDIPHETAYKMSERSRDYVMNIIKNDL